jgi:hypothetical protein
MVLYLVEHRDTGTTLPLPFTYSSIPNKTSYEFCADLFWLLLVYTNPHSLPKFHYFDKSK